MAPLILASLLSPLQRTPHIDLNWYLRFSPDEPEIRLARTLQHVLACRYQPATLRLIGMTEQVQEAEVLRYISLAKFHFKN